MKRSTLLLCGLFIALGISSQEVAYPLASDPHKAEDTRQRLERMEMRQKQGAVSLELPFIDDFSKDHFPGNEDGLEVYWENLSATLFPGYGLDAPSIGQVVFEGLDALGTPYDFSNPQVYGRADSLISMPINLEGAESVVLSFYFQPQGLGFAQPQPDDSLTLDFYSPSEDRWVRQWHANGSSAFPFAQILLEVDEDIFLEDGFRFCFSNYCTLSGSLNHWVVDWIYLGANRSTEDDVLVDVGFAEAEHTLLTSNYTSIPWKHFIEGPAAQMAPIKPVTIKNNNSADAFIPSNGYSVFYDGSEIFDFDNDTTPNVPAFSNLDINQAVTVEPAFFIYPDGVATDSATFEVFVDFTTSPDLHLENNSMAFQQEFKDYYAYDDGTAEQGYGLEGAPGGRVAFAFDILEQDTLRGFDMYFLPISIDIDDEIFFLTVWDDANGQPGEEIYQDAISRTPDYTEFHQYKEYVLQDTLVVSPGTYYIGWVQSGTTRLNIGNDKNIDNNTSRLFFRTSNTWSGSNIAGTLMMRPVFGPPPAPGPVSIPELSEIRFGIRPNPADDHLLIDTEWSYGLRYELFEAQGRAVERRLLGADRRIQIAAFEAGVYLLRIIHPSGAQSTQRFVIQH